MSICISNLCYRIDDAVLLNDISVRIGKGALVAVVGPNGSGKSSLLKVAGGEVRAQEGQVTIAGKDIQAFSLSERACRFGILPQEAGLDFPFTVKEVVEMGRIPHMTRSSVNQRIVDEVLQEMQLQHLSPRVYPTLSGGEKQRVQIARVLCQIWDVCEQACLYLDEPTAALDMSHQIALFSILGRLRDKGATIIVVLHDINLALRYAQQIILLSKGSLLAAGEPLEVIHADNIREAFNVEIEVVMTKDSNRPFVMPRQ